MKINIVNYEQGLGINGILTKYAREMEKALIDLGHEVGVSNKPMGADINHHINYESYIPSGGNDTTMITHIDSARKIKIVKDSLKTSVGICFSKGVKDKLVKQGCDENKLAVVMPAHDGLKVRPRIIAISTNLYPDGRKREEMFAKMFRSLKEPRNYTFRIMGKGWKPVLDPLTKDGIQVQWLEKFTLDFYNELLNTSDFLLYTGEENALAQSIIDAKNAHLRIIAPPQEDLEVEYPFTNQEELNLIFKKIAENPVEKWTWENYCKNHLKIWVNMLNSTKKKS